ncbi:MAG: alpha/beta hydrolase [Deltaproteobacteria bacterium]|nr:alpha/beta hydrolase [Deltaproteobacteria bacterium]
MSGQRYVKVFVVVLLLLSTGCTTLNSEREDTKTVIDKGAPNYCIWENDRKVSWLECGDLEGFPVFYAHGNPGSRLEILFMEEKAREYGIRLIVFERPGIGKSDYVEGYPLLAFAQDLKRFADEKGIQYFGLMGWSSGGPPVLAAAYYMPERVRFVFSISGYTNFGEYNDARKLMEEYGLYGPSLSEETPILFKIIIRNLRRIDLFLPEYYSKISEDKMCAADREILKNQSIADLFSHDQQEALVGGARGTIQDLQTQWAPWEFKLEEIKVPVHIFQGKQDTFVPWQFAEHLADTIPDATLHLYDERGHLFPLSPMYQDELFKIASSLIKTFKP